jgi:predicted metal-dependent peptidase
MSLKDFIISENIPDKITNIIIDMITSNFMPFYAEFCFNINFIKANIKTCGISVTSNGIYFLWSEEFVNSLSKPELVFVIIHEIFHVLFDHPKRSVGYDQKIANLAQDMIINSTIWHDIIMSKFGKKTMKENGFIDSPRRNDEEVKCPYCKGKSCSMCDEGKIKTNIGFFVPKEYGGEWLFEDLYFWLLDEYEKWKENNQIILDIEDDDLSVKIKSNGKISDIFKDHTINYGLHGISSDKKYEKKPIDTYPLDEIFENLELLKGLSLDEHLDDECSEEVRKQVVGNVLNRIKNAGISTSDVEVILGKLQKKKEDYLKYIKRDITLNVLGNKKNRTIIKPNRRGIPGLKGKRKYSTEINCLLDVSGSMSGIFEEVLSYIFQKDISINLIQCDTEVKNAVKINKMSELNKMKINGLGGTELNPGLEMIANNKHLNKLNTVILTDGMIFENLNFSKIKGYNLIITTDTKIQYSGTDKIKQIKVKN